MSDIKQTIDERGQRYGDFAERASIEQDLLDTLWATRGWTKLAADQRSALTMICVKMSRIMNGDHDYHDNWHDLSCYAALVANRLTDIPALD